MPFWMFNIQISSPALRQEADFARVDIDSIVAHIGSFRILIGQVWRVFAQEGADVLARGCAICAAAIQPSIRVNRDNARGVAYKVNAAVIVIIHAAAAIRTVFQIAGVVRGGVVVAVSNLLVIHSQASEIFICSSLSGTITL